jgi:RNA-directed DNA polymerase
MLAQLGWKQLPKAKMYGEYGLVQLVKLIPSIASQKKALS